MRLGYNDESEESVLRGYRLWNIYIVLAITFYGQEIV